MSITISIELLNELKSLVLLQDTDNAMILINKLEKLELDTLSVGDNVKIAETSDYYIDGDVYNPIGEFGVIRSLDCVNDHFILVQWGDTQNNQRTNVYRPYDLIKVLKNA